MILLSISIREQPVWLFRKFIIINYYCYWNLNSDLVTKSGLSD